MSYKNRKRKYELYKGTPKLSDALKREFEGESPEELEAREEAAKEEAEKKLNEELEEGSPEAIAAAEEAEKKKKKKAAGKK